MRRQTKLGRWHRLLMSEFGVAATEFALIAPLLCLIVLGTTDLAFAYNRKLKIKSAVTAVAYYVFSNGQSFSAQSDAQTLITNAKNLFNSMMSADDLSLTLDFRVNNSATGATWAGYYCASGYPPTFSASTSGGNCGANITAGQFFTIAVSGQMTSYFPAASLFGSYLDISETLIVRLS